MAAKAMIPPRRPVGCSWLVAAALPACLLLTALDAQAQPTEDDELRPPPGTPGSTAEDEPIRPPPGTPGSTAAETPPDQGATPATLPPAAQPKAAADESEDRFAAVVSSRTFVRLFQRRYLAGTVDPIPEEETFVPIYEYASLRVDDVDAPWGKDSLDFRLSGWGMVDTVDVSQGERLTGDLLAANVRARYGIGYAVLGRQVTAGGAARLTRFDGASLGFRLQNGLAAEGYGGFSAAPRFRSTRQYVLLGSPSDSPLRDPNALPDSSLTGYWLAGGRISYVDYDNVAFGAAFHEEREHDALGRRWVSADAAVRPLDDLRAGALGILDLDATDLAEARGYVDYQPIDPLETRLELIHSTPSLFLSRASVLSVFSLDSFTEAGGEARYRILAPLSVGVHAYQLLYSEEGRGHRLGAMVRASAGARDALVGQLRYSRVGERDVGYHAVRGSLSYRLPVPVTATADVHQYLYDAEIRGVGSSTYGSATAEYGDEAQPWKVMVGGVVARTPYAEIDAQAIARFSYDIDLASVGRER